MRWPRQIYFARRADGAGPIKIGCSRYPKDRRVELGYAVRHPLVLLAVVPGDLTAERELHKRFSAHRAKKEDFAGCSVTAAPTEWFEPVPELLSLIEKVAETGQLPMDLPTNRDAVIFVRRSTGETLQSIADDVGLTRERVRQIVRETQVRLSRVQAAKAA